MEEERKRRIIGRRKEVRMKEMRGRRRDIGNKGEEYLKRRKEEERRKGK